MELSEAFLTDDGDEVEFESSKELHALHHYQWLALYYKNFMQWTHDVHKC